MCLRGCRPQGCLRVGNRLLLPGPRAKPLEGMSGPEAAGLIPLRSQAIGVSDTPEASAARVGILFPEEL